MNLSWRARFASAGRRPDFPYTLGGRLRGWWVFDEADVRLVGGGYISEVRDRSGGAYHALQASSLAQFEYNTGLGVGAGLGSGGQYMEIPSGYASAMGPDNWTHWALVQTDDVATAQAALTTGSAASGNGYEITINGGGSHEWGARNAGVTVAKDGAADTDPHLIVVSRIAGVLHMYIDNAEVSLDVPNIVVIAPSGVSLLASLTTALWGLIGLLGEAGGSEALTGTPGVGNTCTGELASLWDYVSQRYSL